MWITFHMGGGGENLEGEVGVFKCIQIWVWIRIWMFKYLFKWLWLVAVVGVQGRLGFIASSDDRTLKGSDGRTETIERKRKEEVEYQVWTRKTGESKGRKIHFSVRHHHGGQLGGWEDRRMAMAVGSIFEPKATAAVAAPRFKYLVFVFETQTDLLRHDHWTNQFSRRI